ncbi:MAG: reverse transcriptase domain-containing protein, partial [Chlamydiota bacterium]
MNRKEYIDKNTLYKTEEGTPQEGIISPCLLTMTLAGFEQKIKTRWSNGTPYKAHIITYADDFIITGHSKEFL